MDGADDSASEVLDRLALGFDDDRPRRRHALIERRERSPDQESTQSQDKKQDPQTHRAPGIPGQVEAFGHLLKARF